MLKRGFQLLFKQRDFGLLMAVQFAAQAGDGIVQFALGKFIAFGGAKGFDLESAPSPETLLNMALLVFVPYTFISPFLGVVIDRWDRRRLLFAANAVRAIAVVALVILGIGAVPNAVLLGIFLITLACTRIVLATKAAALPATVAGDSLVEGNAVSQLGGALFQIAAGGAAFLSAAFLPARPIALAGSLVYGAGALMALKIERADEGRTPSTLVREISRVIANIVAGLREVARRPQAGAAITTYFWLRFLWSLTLVGVGLIARDLVAGDQMQRLILTAGGGAVGAALGFLVAARVRARVRNTASVVLFGSVLAGLGTAVLGALQLKISIVLLTFFLGFGFFLAKISLDTLVQQALGDDFRGRAFSLYDIAYNVAWVLAASIMKLWWGDLHSLLIAAMGLVFLGGMGVLAVWYRRAGLLVAAGS